MRSTASRVTSKGQATIPARIRKHLNLKAGDTVIFDVEGKRVVLRKADALDPAFLKLDEKRRAGQPVEHFHTTRMVPKRVDELVDGGSL